ncbi:PAS domain-containing protein [Streptomyces sp. MS1.AVA.1]|uniref:PAS domain-containing protein n=1 Tax=Streptomyces machairae TaxID=3134109 RepID=A0ABU8UUF9_9ACTN
MERLPLGTLALDLGGRITYVNTAAARLLGRPAKQLLGTEPWQALPWLDNIAYMDAYRTAMSSREHLALTVLRPPDQWLDLRLHTDDSGTSILITPDQSSKPLGTQPASPASTPPAKPDPSADGPDSGTHGGRRCPGRRRPDRRPDPACLRRPRHDHVGRGRLAVSRSSVPVATTPLSSSSSTDCPRTPT